MADNAQHLTDEAAAEAMMEDHRKWYEQQYGPGAFEAYEAWCAKEEARGELAGTPETMGCFECGGFNGVDAPKRKVVALGPIAEAHRDPTQTYRLACGHLTI